MHSCLSCLAALLLVSLPAVLSYTNPVGNRLLQDLRAYKGDEAPASWVGTDPCGTQWEGVECSPEGRVLNVALPSWLPHRRLLQDLPPLSQQALDTIRTAVRVVGVVGQTNTAVGDHLPADGRLVTEQLVAPTISAVQMGLESLLPSAANADPPIESPLAASLTIPTPTAEPSVAPSQPPSLGSFSPAPAAADSLSALAPMTAPGAEPLPTAGSSLATKAKPGETLANLLQEIEAIKFKMEMEGIGRKLKAEWWQVPPPPPPFPPPPINYNPPLPQTLSSNQIFAATVPLPADALAPAPTPGDGQKKVAPMPRVPHLFPAAAMPVPVAAPAAKPVLSSLLPQLLPEGQTDIKDLQQAMSTSKSIGRRLLAGGGVAPSTGPSAGKAYNMVMAPESAPVGVESPSQPVNVFQTNKDGSSTLMLPQGKIGDFILPSINASLPAKPDITLNPINIGRKLRAEWWQVPPPPPPFPPPPISPPPPPSPPAKTTIRPAETLLSIPASMATSPAEGPAKVPGPKAATKYQETLAPESAPAGQSSPSGLLVDLPALKIGPFNLPELKGTVPQKTAPLTPGRKRLAEIIAPFMAPASAPTAQGPFVYEDKLAPETAPTGEASPDSGLVLPAINLAGFHLPEVDLGKLPPKKS